LLRRKLQSCNVLRYLYFRLTPLILSFTTRSPAVCRIHFHKTALPLLTNFCLVLMLSLYTFIAIDAKHVIQISAAIKLFWAPIFVGCLYGLYNFAITPLLRWYRQPSPVIKVKQGISCSQKLAKQAESTACGQELKECNGETKTWMVKVVTIKLVKGYKQMMMVRL